MLKLARDFTSEDIIAYLPKILITGILLTSRAIRKHLPKSISSTTMGHMHMIRKGIRSTKPTVNEIMNEEIDPEPILDPPRHINNREHYAEGTTIAFEELKWIVATDLPGWFPTTSGQGNSYVMVMYDFDSDTINAVAIKNRKKESLVKGYNGMYEDLQKAGINPVLHRSDNETSKDLIKEVESKGLKYQIASPGDHCLNHAERAIIQTKPFHSNTVWYRQARSEWNHA
jgi:hypothetical protein